MFRLFQISVFIFFSSVLYAADFEKTYEAYQKGDYESALNGFFELASENHMKAQFYLGAMYREGKGVKQDYSKSLEWYQKAAGHGEPKAQHNVALFYHNGISVSKDIETAIDWYTKAANQNYVPSQITIAKLYYSGNGVKKHRRSNNMVAKSS